MTATYSQDDALFFLLPHNYSNLSYLCTNPLQFSINFVYGFGHISAEPLRPQGQVLKLFSRKKVCFGQFHMFGPSKCTWHHFPYDMSCNNGSSVVFNIPMHQCWDRLVGSVTLLLLEKEWKRKPKPDFFPLLSVPFWTPPPLLHNRTHMLVHTHHTPHTHKSGMLFWDRN